MYVLTEQLHAGGDPSLPFKRYGKYLERNKDRFPASAFKLVSGPLLNTADRHDAWLEWARFKEPAKGARRHIRYLSLRVRLLGAGHDRQLELFYPKVYSYSMASQSSSVEAQQGWQRAPRN